MTTVTITALPELGTISDITYIPVETSGVTQRITGATLKSFVTSTVAGVSLSAVNATTVGATNINAVNLTSGNAQLTGGGITGVNAALPTLQATNFSTANAQITGGSISGVTGQYSTLTATNLSTANAQITGGAISGGTGQFSTLTATNFSSGNIQTTGGNIAVSYATATNFSSGNVQLTGGNIAVSYATATNFSSGNVQITYATATNLSSGNLFVTGNVSLGGNIIPTANATYNLGNATSWFGTFYGVSSQAKYADLAEKYTSDAQYEPGTVVVFGDETEVTISKTAADNKVAGVITTNPAYLMNADCDGVAVALVGRVPCKVIGTIARGDMLVTSSTQGVATAFAGAPSIGTVIGKALAPYNNSEEVGVIEVVVGRL